MCPRKKSFSKVHTHLTLWSEVIWTISLRLTFIQTIWKLSFPWKLFILGVGVGVWSQGDFLREVGWGCEICVVIINTKDASWTPWFLFSQEKKVFTGSFILATKVGIFTKKSRWSSTSQFASSYNWITDLHALSLNISQTISIPDLYFSKHPKIQFIRDNPPPLQQSAVFQIEIKTFKMEGFMFSNGNNKVGLLFTRSSR